MSRVSGTGNTRTVTSSGGVTTIVCTETSGVATQAAIYNDRAATYKDAASALTLQF
jgi:hypothetical protein